MHKQVNTYAEKIFLNWSDRQNVINTLLSLHQLYLHTIVTSLWQKLVFIIRYMYKKTCVAISNQYQKLIFFIKKTFLSPTTIASSRACFQQRSEKYRALQERPEKLRLHLLLSCLSNQIVSEFYPMITVELRAVRQVHAVYCCFYSGSGCSLNMKHKMQKYMHSNSSRSNRVVMNQLPQNNVSLP